MKISFLLLVSFLLAGKLAAQHLATAQVPAPVRQAFIRAQPAGAKASWHQTGNTYEATFPQPEGHGMLVFTPEGELLETQTDIPYAEFPALARTATGQQFPHRRLDRITKVVNTSGEITYVVKVCKGSDKNGKDKDCQTSVFDHNGRPKASSQAQ